MNNAYQYETTCGQCANEHSSAARCIGCSFDPYTPKAEKREVPYDQDAAPANDLYGETN